MSKQSGTAVDLAVGSAEFTDEAQLNQAMKRLKLLHIKV